jgi:hypothetical protein
MVDQKLFFPLNYISSLDQSSQNILMPPFYSIKIFELKGG